ncbi:hypothetical protein PT974_06928 [Cladobotryum mycophilum]|uniref:Uncharacterized protein n=1 Tax=Cladobotryum mycophilum TaxID=491253 RepID=A0ABR0SNZ2_9HYPO
MAQQGGTYRVPTGADAVAWSKFPSQAARKDGDKDDNKTDSREWEVVTNDEANYETHTHTKRTSTHFDIKVGFGTWKWTLFRWDSSRETSIRPGAHQQEQKRE